MSVEEPETNWKRMTRSSLAPNRVGVDVDSHRA